MKTAIGVVVVLAALAALSACATPAGQAALTEEERCARYGSLWSPLLGRCMHPGSGGGM
jgi:hypothetical protein